VEASDRLADRTLVRATLMRNTIHLLRAADLLAWRGLFTPLTERWVANRPLRERLEPLGEQLPAVIARGRDLLHAEPLTAKALGARLAEDWPDVDPGSLATAARVLTPTVHVTPRGLWRTSGQTAFTTIESWLGEPPEPHPDADDLFRRYLAAFGPATVLDAQVWSGLTRLGAVAERLRPELVAFRDEHGRELFDLPDAPRPGPDAAAPVRLLPEWDNLLLSHVDKTFVIDDDDRRRVFTANGIIYPSVLVHGRVEGTWRTERDRASATVTLLPFRRWSKAVVAEATSEAGRLLAITDPGAEPRVVVAAPS
jgi:hypothetical protein